MSQKTRLWMLVTGMLGAVVLLYGVFAGLVPLLGEASNTHALTEDVNLLNDTQRLQLTMLQQSEENSGELEKELAELQLAIPASAEWAQFLEQLQEIEAVTGARVISIAVDPSVMPEASVPETDPTAEATDAAAGEDTAYADAATAEMAEPAAPAPVTGLVDLPVTISLTGDVVQVTEFMRKLQTLERLFFARSVDVTTDEEGATGTISGSIFLMI